MTTQTKKLAYYCDLVFRYRNDPELRKTKEFSKAIQYLNVMKCRKIIPFAPQKNNNYKVPDLSKLNLVERKTMDKRTVTIWKLEEVLKNVGLNEKIIETIIKEINVR